VTALIQEAVAGGGWEAYALAEPGAETIKRRGAGQKPRVMNLPMGRK
jgi:hypothetical protein